MRLGHLPSGQAATWFGPASVLYTGGGNEITAQLKGPHRNPPGEIRLRFRAPDGRLPESVTVNGQPWTRLAGEWVRLPGNVGTPLSWRITRRGERGRPKCRDAAIILKQNVSGAGLSIMLATIRSDTACR